MSPKILNLLLDFSLGAILKKFLIFAHFQPPIFIKMIVIKTNGVYKVRMAGHPEKRLGRFYSVTHFLYRFLHAYKLNPFSPRKVKIPISRKGSSPQIFSWQTAKQSSFQQIDREILEPSDCRQSPYRKFRNLASETVLFAPLGPKALLSCSPSLPYKLKTVIMPARPLKNATDS